MKIPSKSYHYGKDRHKIKKDAIKAAQADVNASNFNCAEEVEEFITVSYDEGEAERVKMDTAEFYLNDVTIVKSNVSKLGSLSGLSGIKVVNNRKV